MRGRALLSFGVFLLLGSFWFWHSGGRAAALCERKLFVRDGAFSLWPPGATCTYGEPSIHDTLLNDRFVGSAVGVFVVVCLLAILLLPAQRG